MEAKKELQWTDGLVPPGWYQNLSNDFYHRVSKGWSSSWVKKMHEESPAKVKYLRENPEKPNAAMRLGTAVHSLVMEPDYFDRDNYIVRSSYWKAVDEARQEYPDKNVITEDQFKAGEKMAANVLSHPYLKHLFSDGIAESSIYQWYDGIDPYDYTQYREMIKVRPDFIPRGYPILMDLKTAADASHSGFIDAICHWSYDLSAAMYMHTANHCKELLEHQGIAAFTNFIFVVAESSPPYQVAWYEMRPEWMEHGLKLFERGMYKIHQAKKNNWPPYNVERQWLEMPAYRQRMKIVDM